MGATKIKDINVSDAFLRFGTPFFVFAEKIPKEKTAYRYVVYIYR